MIHQEINLNSIYEKLPDKASCIGYLEQIRWEGRPKCPHCNSSRFTPVPKENRYRCNSCNTSYSVTVRTIFHKTHVELQKWFYAIFLLNSPEILAISSRNLAKVVAVNKITAMAMINKIEQRKYHEHDLYMRIIDGLTNEAKR